MREERSGGAWILNVDGPLRVPLNGDLQHRVNALLYRGVKRILVNLAGVRDLDAGGVGELVRVYNMTIGSRGDLRITDATPGVRELLDRVGLLDLLSADSWQRWRLHFAAPRRQPASR